MKKSVHIFAVLTLAAFTLFSCASKEKEIPETLPEAEITAPEEVNEDSDSVEESQTTEEDTPDETDSTEDDEVQDVSEVQIIEEDFLEEIIEPEVFEEELPPEPEEPEIQDITEDLPEAVEAEPLSQEETSDMENLLITSEQEAESQNEPDSAESESTDIVTDIPKEEETDKNDSENNIKNTIENNIDEVIDFADSSADEVENLDSETTNEEEKVQEEEPVIIPSRSVSLKNGQSLDIEYPGKGWIFLGATDGSKNLTSTGRKTNPKTTNFTLIARVPGTVILHFYKEDLLEGKYIDDYLEVTVEDIKSKSSIHVKAPAYSEVVPKKPEPVKPEPVKPEPVESEPVSQEPENQESKKSGPLKTEPKKLATIKPEPAPAPVSKTITEEPKTDILSAEEYLSRAKKAQDEKNYTEMYNNLQNFLLIADQNKDEGLFLLAGLYEGNSEYRNIKKSVELYEEITETYPLSPFFDEAQKREIYLRRFYMNGR
ncbi:MAG: hypothetical protein MJ182_09320 [Treponema sp.]|nr:hypothetical protein [Treponema sp.]